MSKILISYRREDSADITGRIHDRLIQVFPTTVFMDVDSMPLGVDFRTHLDEQVAECAVLLAVIGPDWMGPKDSEGKSRLDNPEDYVRIEIESVLKRQIRVIPLLVRGAVIPSDKQLPKSLYALSYRNGLAVRSDPDFHRDMDRLIKHLKIVVQAVEPLTQVPDMHTQATENDKIRGGRKTGPEHLRVVDRSSGTTKLEQPPIPLQTNETKTTPSQPVLIGGLGLIILLGAVVAFPLLQTKPALGPQMKQISLGSFKMGGLDNQDRGTTHQVQLTKPFAIARHETTFDEYDRFAQATDRPLPEDQGWGRGNRPVINVSWHDAKAYALWLSKQTGSHYRLPTEAEWEYAARSGGKDEIWAGISDLDELKDYAVYGRRERMEPVGRKKPNGLGLYDMSGNVWEWVEDCWNATHDVALRDVPAASESDDSTCDRMRRGGSGIEESVNVRVSSRLRLNANSRGNYTGFRLAQDLP